MTDDNSQAIPHVDHGGVDFSGQRVLVIGSGADLNGRAMGPAIDARPDDGGQYDYVIRCNRLFGDPVDVGTRCDLAAVRYPEWTKKYGLSHAKDYISFNGAFLGGMRAHYPGNWSIRERENLAAAIGVRWPSCGALAVNWALQRGASKENLHVIGFGYDAATDTFAGQKTYPDGTTDPNPNYNWPAENAWLRSVATLL